MQLRHCIISHPPKLQGAQATSLRSVPSSCVLCTEFSSLRIKCLMAPSLFSLAASRMSWPWHPFKPKIWCRWFFVKKRCIDIDMLGSFKVANPELEKTCERLNSEKRKSEWTHWSMKMEQLRTSQDNMQSWNTQKKLKQMINKLIHTNRIHKEGQQNEKGNRNGRKSKGKPCKERIQQRHQARQSQHADMSYRCRGQWHQCCAREINLTKLQLHRCTSVFCHMAHGV